MKRMAVLPTKFLISAYINGFLYDFVLTFCYLIALKERYEQIFSCKETALEVQRWLHVSIFKLKLTFHPFNVNLYILNLNMEPV